jgi:putative oxidoreductase
MRNRLSAYCIAGLATTDIRTAFAKRWSSRMLLKYQSWEFTVRLFQEEYRVPLLDPAVAARIAMVQELTIPILLFLGLATRIATLPLLGMIAVIQTFVYPNAYNEHLVWGAILVLLLTRGPGVFSIDHLISRFARRSAIPSEWNGSREAE